MDALLLLNTRTSIAKRPCPSSSSNPNNNNNNSGCSNRNPDMNQQVDNLLQTFLSLAGEEDDGDLGIRTSSSLVSSSIDRAFERLMESSPSDLDQSLLIDRAIRLGSLLLEAGNRSSRSQSSKHNSISWPLPPDLTIKVFSMLDTQSLCYAAATCSMFHKCTMDPLCYAHIDLTTVVPKVNNAVVATMVQRAGKALQSLKLGIVSSPSISVGSCQPLVYGFRNSVDVSSFSWNEKKTRQGKESSILTRTCLNPLNSDSGFAGVLLRRLHLYNIERMDGASLFGALSACTSLLDLEIAGLHVELRQTLVSVSMNCHLIERLFFESSKTGRDDSLKSLTCNDLVNNCPNITSLALRGFKLHDWKVRILVKGFRRLKYVDLSTSYSITGNFLRNLGGDLGGNLLEVVILQDCMHLKEIEVARLLTAVLEGDFKNLQHLDVSNREGLSSDGDWFRRCYSSSILPIKQVLETRPDMCILAQFPSDESFIDIEQMFEQELSEISLQSQMNGHTSDGPLFMSTSESSYNSALGSDNEESRDSGYIVYEESSDEVDFLVL